MMKRVIMMLCCCSLQLFFTITIIAQSDTVISVNAPNTVTAGEAIMVSIDVANAAEAVHGFELSLAYDETLFDVDADGVSAADWVTSTGRTIACSTPVIADGMITIACATIDDDCMGIVGPAGSGTLATINLIPTQEGTTTLAVDDVSLQGTAEIAVSATNNSEMTINGSGAVPTAINVQSQLTQDNLNLRWIGIGGAICALLVTVFMVNWVKGKRQKVSVGLFVLTLTGVSLFMLNQADMSAVQAQTSDALDGVVSAYGCVTADSCYDVQYDADSNGTIELSDLMVVANSHCTANISTECDSQATDHFGSYTINDTGFGTQVSVVVDCDGKTRTIESNALPNHDTGDFPNAGNPNTISEQDKLWTYSTEPTFVGTATFAREPGVAINGVKFEPDTAERATCDTGEVHSIEAIQNVTDLGLDFNNAHVQPTGEYHYHGVSDLLVDLYSLDQDLVHVAFAADGHLIYYSKSGAYSPSYQLGTDTREGTNCTYTPGGPNGQTITFGSEKDGSLKSDWDYDATYGDLDECNGITIDGQYIYLITDDYPYIPRCLMGEFVGSGPGGGGPPQSN